jgi:hypothetical protein
LREKTTIEDEDEDENEDKDEIHGEAHSCWQEVLLRE